MQPARAEQPLGTRHYLVQISRESSRLFLVLRLPNLYELVGSMADGQRFLLHSHPRYSEVRLVGKGAFGQVSLAFDKDTGQHVALKFIPRGGQITKYVEREILNQMRLRHPHIIELKEVFLTENHLVVVMEYAEGGDLLRRLAASRKLSEEDARWYFQQIIFAIDYAHRMGVASRDLKLENTLLVSDGPRPLVKLADFGFSKDENVQSAPGSRVGTPAYLAPEVITNVDGSTYDAKKADVWSCGVLLYTMLTGHYPFQRSRDKTWSTTQQLHLMLQRILKVQYSFPEGVELSAECRDLITRMLVADPTHRLSVREVLLHPWTAVGLNCDVVGFNDPLVAKSLANPPAPEVLQDIAGIVAEARAVHSKSPGRLGERQNHAKPPGLSNSGPAEFDDDVLDPDFDDFDFHPV